MGTRIPRLIVAVWIAAAIGCDRPPVERPTEPAPETPEPAPPPPEPAVTAPADPPPAAVTPPQLQRFITPANPDIAPQPPIILKITGKRRRSDLGGGWTVTIEPAALTAAPGDEVEFTIEFRNRKPGSGRPELYGWPGAIRFPDIQQRDPKDPAQWLPLQGGRTRGLLLAGGYHWPGQRNIHVYFHQRQRPGSLGHADTEGPRLNLDTTTIVPVQVRHRVDRCDLPQGLAVTVEGRQVTAYFSHPMSSIDAIRPRGEFVLRRISGRLTLVGFVEIEFSDFVTGAPQGAPCPHLPPGMWSGRRWIGAIEAQFTAPEPGPIDIVFFAIIGGFNGTPTREPRHATAVVVE